ncbi:hypothetical protein SAMN06265374_4363 [Roseibium denhamense]|uniref:Uncharacterized protein n=1 Tax=Roseibium denhamense TaxID=76305 RepID=A0ABY1PPE9_9HYPH|nr:hypothetical protein SAMN06265374_4363 [Roseibium denhamense]
MPQLNQPTRNPKLRNTPFALRLTTTGFVDQRHFVPGYAKNALALNAH